MVKQLQHPSSPQNFTILLPSQCLVRHVEMRKEAAFELFSLALFFPPILYRTIISFGYKQVQHFQERLSESLHRYPYI